MSRMFINEGNRGNSLNMKKSCDPPVDLNPREKDRQPNTQASPFQQFAPAGAGRWLANVTPGTEFEEDYKKKGAIVVDITDKLNERGLHYGSLAAVFEGPKA